LCLKSPAAYWAAVSEKKAAEQVADMEYECENCLRPQTVDAEELLRNQGLAACKGCGWVGYPEVVPRGQLEQKAREHSERERRERGKKPKRRLFTEKTKLKPLVPEPQQLLS